MSKKISEANSFYSWEIEPQRELVMVSLDNGSREVEKGKLTEFRSLNLSSAFSPFSILEYLHLLREKDVVATPVIEKIEYSTKRKSIPKNPSLRERKVVISEKEDSMREK